MKKTIKTKTNNNKKSQEKNKVKPKKVASPTPSPKLNKTLEKFKKEFLPINSTSGKARQKKLSKNEYQ